MAVVIQEFDVVPETAPSPQDANASRDQTDSTKKKEQPDAEGVMRLWHERAERVRAH